MTEPPGAAGPGEDPDAAGEPGQDPGDGPEDDDGSIGADLARTALGRARAAAAARGLRPGRVPLGGKQTREEWREARRGGGSTRSGAHPDARDPQSLDSTLGRLVGERGWEQPVAVGGAFGRWDVVVGPELAGHCTPETLKDGTLVVRAESTAWATQVRLLTSHLVRRLDEELGHGVVTKVVVRGPQGPSWRKGGRSAPGGRGPRDTYG
ncbi:putative nucleic acid-binding Zn ribbon protein [Kineococcus radiotolerans]|uniref:Putative nucleic acid-binding Zn ribbon protein n=1 Tax=Kineococcus radiotolerans TaxID=131568 RepID=A0A7W4TM12_KINRA|nr:DciA family protein [Kineococcus radiotolerans]MBB2901372.1 putative nucleic acid-binding Zn ribbon protein [Kineococcus radiotolerans]